MVDVLDAAQLHVQIAVVTGSGCIGLMSLLSLKARGVSKVIVVDVMDKRLAQAKKLGAVGFTCNHWLKAFDWAKEVGGITLVK